MSTQEPEVGYGTTGERLRSFALSEGARERVNVYVARYWEASLYLMLVLAAGVLRFVNLGERAMHHDESLHGFYSWGLTEGLREVFTSGTANVHNYHHVPFMHGPFQFIGSGIMMAIMGDGDYQARMLAATMGTGLVLLPLLLRKQLGVIGALAAAMFIAFSPTLMYYSRFTREDIYTAFWTLGLVCFIWRYIASREDKFLFLAAGFMAAFFATKETAFFTVGSFLFFLSFMLAMHIADKIRAKSPISPLAYGALVAGLSCVGWIIAIAWPFIGDWRAKYKLDQLPAEGVLLVVLGTLAGPQYAAAIQILPGFGSTWQLRNADAGNLHVAEQEKTVAFITIFMLIAASTALGLAWNARKWAFAAAAFWIPFVLLYTTFFTNWEGLFSGMWGSLDYWISQQDVQRGNQPDYYYFITIPVYEFLPLVLSLAAMAYYGIAGDMRRGLAIGGGVLAILFLLVMPAGPVVLHVSFLHVWIPFAIALLGVMVLPMEHFTKFLIFWLVSMSLALTVASEKMPWLNVHIALPLAILAGRFVGDIVTRTDIKAELPKLERLAPFLYAGAASALSILVFVIVGPFTPAAFGGWALAVVAGIAVYWAATGYSRKTAMQVALVGFVAAFTIFSVRAAVLASLGHPDNPYVGDNSLATRDYGEVPTELLVYTQTSGDIPVLRDRLAELARKNGKGYDQTVIVDSADGFTWPWAWYLRDYKGVVYVDLEKSYSAGNQYVPDYAKAPVMFVADGNINNVALNGQFEPGLEYHHRRWFPEEYRGQGDGYSTHDFFGDVVSPSRLGDWLDFWVRRTLPAREPGTVDGVAFFPVGSGVVPVTPQQPTVRTEGAQLVIGGQGFAEGEMNSPADVAFDAAGNIYVADTKNNRIEKYDANGVYQASGGGFQSTELKLTEPWSMTVAADGSVFVADTWAHRIVKLDSGLNEVQTWGAGCTDIAAGCDPLQLFGPREITLAPSGNVLIADTGNSRIIEYTANGEFVREFGTKGTSGGPTEFSEPVGILVNGAGEIYVGDFWNKRVVVLTPDLQFKTTISVDAWGSNAVTDRAYMALLPDGRLLVTDPTGGNVLAFGADGALLATYKMPIEGSQPFARPIGIATDGTSVLVADSNGNVVRKIPLAEIIP